MRLRTKLSWIATAAVVAAGLLVVPVAPAQAANLGACTIAGAGVVPNNGTWNFNVEDCPNDRGWAKVNLTAGSTITMDIDAGTSNLAYFEFFEPGTTDFNWTIDQTHECRHGKYSFSQLICQVGISGQWAIYLRGSTNSITTSTTTVPPTAGRVAGTCLISTAPWIAARITQYGFTGCAAARDLAFWKINLVRGDTIGFALAGLNDEFKQVDVDLWRAGTTDYTLFTNGAHLCGTRAYTGSPKTAGCTTASVTGTYVISLEGGGRFAPLVHHQVNVKASGPASVKRNRNARISAKVTSPAGDVPGVCKVQKRSGGKWRTAKTVKVMSGKCTAKLNWSTKGTKKVRVLKPGMTTWSGKVSKTVKVRVR